MKNSFIFSLALVAVFLFQSCEKDLNINKNIDLIQTTWRGNKNIKEITFTNDSILVQYCLTMSGSSEFYNFSTCGTYEIVDKVDDLPILFLNFKITTPIKDTESNDCLYIVQCQGTGIVKPSDQNQYYLLFNNNTDISVKDILEGQVMSSHFLEKHSTIDTLYLISK